MTLFELKEKMAGIKEAIQADGAWIAEKSGDPTVKMEDLEAKRSHKDELLKRFEMLKAEHDQMEAAQKEAVKRQADTGEGSEKEKLVKAKAAFYRAAVKGQDVNKAYAGLGAIPTGDADLGSGEKLLPKNMSRELLTEPEEENPLRGVCRITNITGLEEPKLGFTISDASIGDVTDKQTAKEIELSGDTVVYGNLKAKVKATVKETVLNGTDLDLVSAIETNLRSAIAYREKHFAFLSKTASASDTVHNHMSFYSAANAIKEVEGATLYEAIVNAYADLADRYSANAKVVMRKADYYAMISKLTNTAESLFSDKPATILGVPVVFCEKAETPVVGDFNYYGINYNIGATLDSDKNVDTGDTSFVLTCWGDQQIRMKSAFRLCKVKASSGE